MVTSPLKVSHQFTPSSEGPRLGTLPPLPHHFPFPPMSFRMNTCESVSKQTTLSIFRMNTYEKHRGALPPSRAPRLAEWAAVIVNQLLSGFDVQTGVATFPCSDALFIRSCRSFTKECLGTPLQPTRSALFFKTAGCVGISNQFLEQLLEDSRLPAMAGTRRGALCLPRPVPPAPACPDSVGNLSGTRLGRPLFHESRFFPRGPLHRGSHSARMVFERSINATPGNISARPGV